MMRRALLLFIALAAVGATLTVVTPAVAGGGGICHEEATEATASMVELRKACFTPTVARVDPGGEVAFVNRDGFTHNVVGLGTQWGDIEGMDGGETRRFTFKETGIFPYACTLHVGMVGAVVVGGDETHAGDVGAVAAAISGPPEGRAKDASPVAAEESVASWFSGAGALFLVMLVLTLVIGAALLARRRASRQRAIRSAI